MDAVRKWLETTVDTGDYPAFDPDNRVLDEPFRGPRPSGPYISIRMLTFNRMRSSTGDPGWTHDTPNATVESILRVQCYGEEAWDWLDQALALIGHYDVDQVLVATEDKGYQIEPASSGEINDLSMMLDMDQEIRGFVEVLVSCRRVIDRVIPEVTDVTVDDYDITGSGDPLESQISVSLE